MRYHDTGSAVLNYAVNWFYGLANLTNALVNVLPEVFTAVDKRATAVGLPLEAVFPDGYSTCRRGRGGGYCRILQKQKRRRPLLLRTLTKR